MPGTAVAVGTGVEGRVSRLARMPADPEDAIARLQQQVRHAWTDPGGGGARSVRRAMHAACPILPGLRHPLSARLEDLLHDLETALANHHPEEIRVATYAWLSRLVELVHDDGGPERVQALLMTLECA